MTMAKSSVSKRRGKGGQDRPPKPYKDFPLTPHPAGYWCKTITARVDGGRKTKLHYFGRWGKIVNGKMVRLPGDGWQTALDEYERKRDDLYAGRKPRPEKIEGLTVGYLREKFLTAKTRALDAGEITARTYAEYRATADRLLAQFGADRRVDDLDAGDFENSGRRSPSSGTRSGWEMRSSESVRFSSTPTTTG
jgi:hypothetical protein